MSNRTLLLLLCAAVLSGCSYGPTTQAAPGSQVGSTGNVQYSHKVLSPNNHMVTVQIAPGLAETEASMAQRMTAFASEFAAKTCPARFDFLTDPSPQRSETGIVERTKVYTFRCS